MKADYKLVSGAARFVVARWGCRYAAEAAAILASPRAVSRVARKIRALPGDAHTLSVLGTLLFWGGESAMLDNDCGR